MGDYNFGTDDEWRALFGWLLFVLVVLGALLFALGRATAAL